MHTENHYYMFEIKRWMRNLRTSTLNSKNIAKANLLTMRSYILNKREKEEDVRFSERAATPDATGRRRFESELSHRERS
uniref:Uncharacterized protein n=1 Tax=Steinernema glaseri TaxID=37863 RepID=A0A1I7YV91_9BILA